jgi:hypothetical protein
MSKGLTTALLLGFAALMFASIIWKVANYGP